ncbi:flagellar basal body rod protein FlgC [Solilutibacter silvestris]|uniref:flagellar basal body rod protein FlgC n=1 Tax=Solilutibacter silvestris TaxID=1645665 RepID=UPI003D33A569
MPIDSILDVARTGMAYERARMEASSRNIAGANVPLEPGQQAKAWQVGTDFESMLGNVDPLVQQPTETKRVLDPGHPYADKSGEVAYPAVDMSHEMTTMMGASRGYEANVRAFNLLRSMMLRGLEIGAK